MKMNKKGLGRELVFFVAFIIIVLTSVAVVYVTSVYNNKDFGMGNALSRVLKERLADCIEEKETSDLSDFEVFSECHLSRESLDEASYYFGFFKKEKDIWVEKKFYGDGGFRERCEYYIKQSKKPENYPFCQEYFTKTNEEIRILVGIRDDNDKKNKGIDAGQLGAIADV